MALNKNVLVHSSNGVAIVNYLMVDDTKISDLTLEVDSCKTKVASLKNNHDQAQSELNSARMPKKKWNMIHKLLTLSRSKGGFSVKRVEMDQNDCALMVEKAQEEFEKLQAEQSGLEKRVNKKVMAMFEKAEDEYNDFISNKHY
ncbi:unnamed protein product [Fraxinus pennsylvanica]|uniref:Uncharacterized protein n=1 Tax=Fraxinus pennsylvanica TaxID=56036 RepID=A0AAD1ZND1_9LAMI|nr:unnamed protein product [Fraxinus pennsylvanica]